ncbi:energy transducer TonB [Taibaiella koreensis]|uniref:energy transducer TonB n=1 Tax=Taibaiella koreensis TaxID=1268548 RepID=UPI000E59A2B6|nr:energy transducer TonB [Taibaiella koreensis]
MRLLSLFLLCCSLAYTAGAQQPSVIPAVTLFGGTRPETLPAFPGGTAALLRFITQNLYIPDALEAFAGRIIIRFDIDEQGRPDAIRIIRSPDPAIDSAAIAMVKKMPRWEPALRDGKPTRYTYHLPLVIHTL